MKTAQQASLLFIDTSYDRIWRQCFAGKCTKRTQKAKISQRASSNDPLVVHR